jgi:hypothetical protein
MRATLRALGPGTGKSIGTRGSEEEAVVSRIVSLLRAEKDLRAEVRELRAALNTVDERLVPSE